MNTGMLWFDNDTKTALNERVVRAVKYYAEKYGRVPNMCMISPTDLEKEIEIGGVMVRPWRSILPHHMWIGIETGGETEKEPQQCRLW